MLYDGRGEERWREQLWKKGLRKTPERDAKTGAQGALQRTPGRGD